MINNFVEQRVDEMLLPYLDIEGLDDYEQAEVLVRCIFRKFEPEGNRGGKIIILCCDETRYLTISSLLNQKVE